MSARFPIRSQIFRAAAFLPLAIAACAASLPVIFEPGAKQGEFIARIGSSAVTVTSTGVGFDSEVALRFEGARLVPGELEGPLSGTSNYFLGNDRTQWRRGVPHFARLAFHGVYKGINVVFYGSEGKLEYDFEAAPYADLSRIRLSFTGALSVDETAGGDLRAVTRRGELLHRRPRVIENGQPLASRYVKLDAGGEFGFALEGHDARRTLVIDPIIESATYLGGGSYEAAHALKLDAQGNVYLAGQAPSPGIFSGPFSSANNPGQDAALIKYSPQLNTIAYYVFLGGDQEDIAYSLAIDAQGSAYLTGSTRSINFPVASGFQMNPGGGAYADGFVAKISPDGKSLVYSSYLGGSGTDLAYAIAVDSNGSAYVGGTTGSRNFPISPGAFQPVFGGSVLSQSATGFIAVVSPSGNKLTSATLLGGANQEQIRAIALDGSGSIYAGGNTGSEDFPIRGGGVQSVLPGIAAGFIAKLTPDLTQLLYSTYVGGRSTTSVNALAVDSQGSAVAAGYTSSIDFPVHSAPQATYGGGNSDGFVVKLTPAGDSYTFATYLGGSDADTINDLTLEANGLLTVAGSTASADFPQQAGLQAFAGQSPNQEAFVAKFQLLNNALVFSTLIGGSGDDEAFGVQVDSTGATYLAGVTSSSDFPVKSGAYQSQYGGGGGDMFLVVLSADPALYGLAPSLSATPTVLSFLAAQGEAAPPATLPVAVSSTLNGNGAFTVDWSGTSWLSCNLSHAQAPASIKVFANQAGLGVGVYTGTVRIIPADGSSTIVIGVTLTVATPAPSIQSVMPAQVPDGSPDTVFTLTGAGFESGSLVQLFLEDGTLSQTITPQAASTGSTIQFTIGQSLLFRDTLLQVRVKNPDSPAVSNAIAVQVGNRFPTINAVANAAAGASTGSNPISAGEYVIITGSTLGPALPLGILLENGAIASTQVGTVRVLFQGVAAPLLNVSDGRIIAVAPWGLAGQQTAQVAVEYLGVRSNPVTIAVAPTAPGIFTSDGSGSGQALIFNDSGLSNAPFLPAAKGSVISIYFTGAGAMSPGEIDGQISSAAGAGPSLPVTVAIDGVNCTVVSIGDAVGEVSGMVQASVRVPASVRSGVAIPIEVTIGGVASQQGVVLAIQ
jgi:uncharacterized protein (TIGR03437 family)